jgi:hypothetical protein
MPSALSRVISSILQWQLSGNQADLAADRFLADPAVSGQGTLDDPEGVKRDVTRYHPRSPSK